MNKIFPKNMIATVTIAKSILNGPNISEKRFFLLSVKNKLSYLVKISHAQATASDSAFSDESLAFGPADENTYKPLLRTN